MSKAEQNTESESSSSKQRLVSLDVLRGFDMFWIIGGNSMIITLCIFLGIPEEMTNAVKKQLSHVTWEGFRAFDLIFPLFVFISGVTIPFSILSKRDKGVSRLKLQFTIIKRSLILILLGLSFSIFQFNSENIRFYTVLWLIGMSYFIGASLLLHIKSWKSLIIIFFSTLAIYHLALEYIPYPGKIDEITPSNNLAAYLDRNLFSTKLYNKNWDPEGTIRVITGGMLCLLGGLIGGRIKNYEKVSLKCSGEMLIIACTALLCGWLWSLSLPIIKGLWTPSFILWSTGWSLLLFSLFYTIIDVFELRFIGWIFLPIGMNAITIYVGQIFINFHHTNHFFFGGLANYFADLDTKKLILATGLVFIKWLALYFLYKKKIFLKV